MIYILKVMHYFWLMFLKTLKVFKVKNFKTLKVHLKVFHLDLEKFLLAPGLAWQTALKESDVKELFTNIDMLLMAEKGIRGGIFHAIH